jgi:DNA-directed RNA polymerase subunit RPC12/RpoP
VTPTVAFACRRCAKPIERPFPSDAPFEPCAACGALVELDVRALEGGALVRCPVCAGELLYRQRDFRQAIGCAVVLIAAVLAPFTYYASLAVAALIDALLYALAGEVVICYRVPCKAHIRGLPAGPKVGPFDLSIHDYHRMLARREAQGLAGPDEKIGPPLDSMSHH